MKIEKQTKCINCKYWNIYCGCVLYSQKKLAKYAFGLKCQAYNKTDTFDMPPKPPKELDGENKATFYKKGQHCKWYKFSWKQN